jgi:PAS domain S-box-containing protein
MHGEQHQADSDLAEGDSRHAEDRFRLLVEGVKDYAIFMLDTEGYITSWNSGAERIKGYSADEIIGEHFSRFYPEEDLRAGKPARELEIAESEGRYEEEGWRVRKDGTQFVAHVVLTALLGDDGRLRGFGKVTRDITERKKAEQERERLTELLGRERERLSFLTDATTILASSLNYQETLDNLTRLITSHLADWCSIMLRMEDGAVERVSSEHRDEQKQLLARRLQQGPQPTPETQPALFDVLESGVPKIYGQVDEEVLAHITRDPEQIGTLVPMGLASAMIVPLIAHKNVVGAIFMARSKRETSYHKDDLDLAVELARRAAASVENAQLHERTQELNEELEQRVLERTKDLESFSYSISHDLRAPLRGISGFAAALYEDYAERLDDRGRSYLERVQAGAQRMGELIDDLLNLSRLSSGEKYSHRVDLSELAEEVIAHLRERDPARRVGIRIEPGLKAVGDERLLRVLLENLLGNSWKFTRQREHALIELGRTTTEDGEAFFVSDNGAGFDMAYSDRLFQVFQRLHSSTDFEGTGIGLATAERIVKRHRGRIWAEGQVGRGARFYFTIEG